MIYTYKNALSAVVYDGDAHADMQKVMSVDTETGIVETISEPLRLDHKDEVVTEQTRFRSVYAIHGGSPMAELFLCYGRIQ